MKYIFFILLFSCTQLAGRKPSNVPTVESSSCALILKKLNQSPLPMIENQDLKMAIEEMKAAGITFTQEDLFAIQWSSSLSPIITDEYVSYFAGIILKSQGVNIKKHKEVLEFLDEMDTNQMTGLAETIAQNFINSFSIPLAITDSKQVEKVAKALHLSLDDFQKQHNNFLRAIIANRKIVEITILMRLKNRQQLIAKNLKSYEQTYFDWLNLPLLTTTPKEDSMSEMVIDAIPENYFKVYTRSAYFFETKQLLHYIKKYHAYVAPVEKNKGHFTYHIIDASFAEPSLFKFLNQHYKKLTLKQFEMINQEIRGVDYDQHAFLQNHLRYLKGIDARSGQIVHAEDLLDRNPESEEAIKRLNEAIEDRLKFFDQMDYL